MVADRLSIGDERERVFAVGYVGLTGESEKAGCWRRSRTILRK